MILRQAQDERKWQAGEVRCSTDKGHITTPGWVKGAFGLDFRPVWWSDEPTPDGSVGWCITHLPTGLSFFIVRKRLSDVQAIVDEIDGWTDWSVVNPDNAVFMKSRVNELRDREGHHFFVATTNTIPPWAFTEFIEPEPEIGPKMMLVPEIRERET